MDFDALRARADDFVTGIAAGVTESILEVVDDALTMVETAQHQAEFIKDNNTNPIINITSDMSPEKVRAAVEDILARVKGDVQAKPAAPKAGGTDFPSKDELVRNVYKHLTQNHPAYMSWSKQFEDYNVESQWESDRITLLEDLADLFSGRVEKRKNFDA